MPPTKQGYHTGTDRTILLVEDETIVAMSEARNLKKHGFDVLITDNAPGAIALVQENKVDLILMDIDLGSGKMDGTEAAQKILEDHDIPIVFLTSHAEKEYVDKVKEITRYGYVLKNSGEFVLIESINMAFELFESNQKTKEREKHLRHERDKFSALTNASPIPIIFVDRSGAITYANMQAEVTLEIGKSALPSKTYNDPHWSITDFEGNTITDDQLPFEIVRRTRQPVYNIQHAIQPPSGKRKFLSINGMPLIDEQGQFEGMIAVLNDITEQKKYEDRLEHSEQKYRELFQSMKNGVAVYRAVNNGEDFEFVDLNEAGLSMGNKAREEVIGRRVTEVFPGVEKIGLLDVFRNVYRTGQPQSHPLVHYEDENIEEWVENYVYLLPNELIVAVYADTTGQRKAESALENSRASLQTVLDSIPADVYVCDMETYEVLFMNERMKESFGNDYTGEICYKVFRGVDEPCAHCTNHLLLDEQDRPTGVAKWEDYNPVNNTWYMNYDRAIPWINGRYVKLQIAVDVTDKKAHEDELKRTIEKKEFLMRELNHRVKNNLAMISSLIGLKDSTIGDVADLSDIIRQIDAIRIVHEKLYQSNTVTHIDMKDYIEDLLSTIFSSLTAQHVVVEKDIETCSIPVRSAIPVGLITNEIATNAIKHGFTPDEEACFSVALQRTETNDHYIFTLSNSGKPFPDDIDFTNSNTLGLQLVSTLVEQLNGTIALERNPQPVFTITFPVERRES